MPSLFDRSFEIAGGGRLSSTRTLRFSDSSLARLRWESSAPLRPRIRLDGVDVADTDGVIRPSSSSILSIEVRGPAGTRL
ncbi:MAG TPA: hypothetical protein PKW90_12090, partial [Myxococcota bacterium]|nr:hypothetical protein [Myxococcota bacterium]